MAIKRFIISFTVALALLSLIVAMSMDNGDNALDDRAKQPTGNLATSADARVSRLEMPSDQQTDGAQNVQDGDDDEEVPQDIVVSTANQEEYNELLSQLAARGLTPRQKFPKLNAVLFTATERQRKRLERDFPNFLWELDAVISRPQTPNPNTVAGGVPFGGRLLDWLGLDAEQQNRGQGVTIAILDEPLTQTLSTANANITQLDLYGLVNPDDTSDGHGNAVASILAADGENVAGIVPDAHILSIPVLNADGLGSTAVLADAIVKAADSGVDIISISLGSETPSQLLQTAIDYAASQGAVILAAAGNDGSSTPYYPASCDNVIGVSACDAASNAPSFSNYGDAIDIAAPGVELAADFGGESAELFSGTSASTPCVAGVIAEVMSENPGMTSAEAAQIVLAHADDFGAPGTDAQFGQGVLSYTAASNWNNGAYTDAAIGGHYLDTDNATDTYTPLVISARNAGNADLSSMTLFYSINDVASSQAYLNVTIGQTVSIVVNIPNDQLDSLTVHSAVTTTESESRQDNNAKSTRITLQTPDED